LQDQAKHSITLSIESDLEQISLVRAALAGVLNHFGVIESDIFSIQLAVSEVINNILEHGYKGVIGGTVEVRFQIAGTDVQIEVHDNAKPFPIEQIYRLTGEPVPLEDPNEDWPTRGHGIQIVRQIVDSIDLQSDERGNRLTLVKRISLVGSSAN
jgi:serine/threonine-protein kinase RsbW